MTVCSIEDCSADARARGMCMRHYQTWYWQELRGVGTQCCIPCCEENAKIRGMCGRHYSKWQKYGDALGGKTNSPRGGGTLRTDGYRVTAGRLYHRGVAASMLGRPLLQSEVVHHIDGNPSNNDPRNLIVFASQAAHATHHAALRRIK